MVTGRVPKSCSWNGISRKLPVTLRLSILSFECVERLCERPRRLNMHMAVVDDDVSSCTVPFQTKAEAPTCSAFKLPTSTSASSKKGVLEVSRSRPCFGFEVCSLRRLLRASAAHTAHKAKYDKIKKFSLDQIRDPCIIQARFLN